MKIAVQMDELSSISINTDSTFVIMLEALSRNHELFYYTPNRLSLINSAVIANTSKIISLEYKPKDFYRLEDAKATDLSEMDIILIRQDPPFDMNYITSTYILDKIKDQTFIVNNPTQIRNCPEKIFVCDFPNLTPPTIISSSLKELQSFQQAHTEIIIKPLYGCGGEGIIKIDQGSAVNLASLLESYTKFYNTPIIAQKYLKEVDAGDKRIILLDGKPIGAVSRIKDVGEVRSNFHTGGLAKQTKLTKREAEICETIGPALSKRGLILAGIDVIGDYITEINVTSPTGIQEINALNNTKLESQIMDFLEKKKS